MHYILPLALALLFAYPAKKQKCADLHEGVFILTDITGTDTITRTKEKQIETSNNDKVQIHLKIKWVDDCTYLLFNPTFVNGDLSSSHDNDTLLNVISDIKGDTHTVTSSFGTDDKIVFKLKRIK